MRRIRETGIGVALFLATLAALFGAAELSFALFAPQPYNPYLFDSVVGERRIKNSQFLGNRL